MSSSKGLSWLYHSSSLSSLGCLSASYVLAFFHRLKIYVILIHIIGMHAKLLQWCLTLCNSMGHSPPGSSVHGILQARYWSGLSFPSPGDLPDPGIESMSLSLLHWHVDSLLLAPPGKPCYRYSKLLSIVLESSEASFLHVHIISTQSSA